MPVDNELYNRLSATWWDENEPLSLLHTALNPGRFSYFRDALLTHGTGDPQGAKLLDVGCGGGLLAEEFARLGCQVVGIDPSAPSLDTARAHAQRSDLNIDYQIGTGEDLQFADARFDVVCCSDVLEHVSDLEQVIAEIARVLAPGGIFCFDTINRTILSKLVVIWIAQEWTATRVVPPNLHDWKAFTQPQELMTLMRRHGLDSQEITGLAPCANPIVTAMLLHKRKRGEISFAELGSRLRFQQTKNTAILYMGYAVRAG